MALASTRSRLRERGHVGVGITPELKTFSGHVIVSDLEMPEKDGDRFPGDPLGNSSRGWPPSYMPRTQESSKARS